MGLNSIWTWLAARYSATREDSAKGQSLNQSPIGNFIELIEGDLPRSTKVTTLSKRLGHIADRTFRTIKVTRTDGSTWLCRASTPEHLKLPIADIVCPMPDGRSFSTGYYVVNRDNPKQSDWIMEPDGIKWSESRDLVFFYKNVCVVAFGRDGLLWRRDLPDADPGDFLLFDFIHEGVFYCSAEQWEKDADGDKVFAQYAIDTSGNVSRTLEQP